MSQTPTTGQAASQTPVADASTATATAPTAVVAPSMPVTPAHDDLLEAHPALLSAAGLPVDEFHGQGGTFLIENGVRVRID